MKPYFISNARLGIIMDRENYILQRKIEYASLFEDINGEFSKVRMTKAVMVNVYFNKKDAIWIGGTTAFTENNK